MKSLFISISVLVGILTLPSCRNLEDPVGIPECIQGLIEEEEGRSDPQYLKVTQYSYHGQMIFVFKSAHIAVDGSSPVYDRDCNIICYLDGWGIGPCSLGEDFNEDDPSALVIWQR